MKKLFKSKLFLQVIVASIVATLATVGIVAATTTIGTNISTGTITATSLSGMTTALTAAQGGTGWATINSNTLLLGNGTGALATTSAGTAGYVLMYTSGAPTWVATSSVAAKGANSDITSLSGLTTALTVAQGGTGWGTINANTLLLGNGTGAIATTSAGTNGFVLGLSAGVPTWIATTSLSTITGTLPVANGGTGATSAGAALTALGAAPTASPTFTGTLNVAGLATTTAQGIIVPNATSTTPTAYCGATTAGGLLWVTATQRLCVCTGSSWQLATSTGTCQ